MKKFNFRLKTVLKLKEFNENKVKIELGQINQKRAKIKQDIEQCELNIRTAKKEENTILKNPVTADFLPYYPRYIKAQRGKVKLLQEDLRIADREYEDKLQELNKARGEVKTFEKLREKSLDTYKRDLRRKEILDAEESVNAKRYRDKQS